MLSLLLLACTSSTPTPESSPLLGLVGDTAPDTDSDTDHEVETGDTVTTSPALHLSEESYRCAPGDLVDANLQIPQGAVIQSYVLVDESTEEERRFQWMLATDRVVTWGEDGAADLSCSWSPGPAGAGVFWEGIAAQVVAVRVVWVAPE